jgi:16S rRNA (cytosine1402-N4)-methyltransferase
MSEQTYHIPALLKPTIESMAIQEEGVYADATFGGGGHSRAIMEHLGLNGHLYGFDRDMDAFANRIDDPRFTFVHSNFRYMENFLRYHKAGKIDGIIADLGVSFHHFDDAERGFSFRSEAPLDMRMNQKGELTGSDVVNTYTDRQLLTIFSAFGDLKKPMPFVRAIIKAREEKPILTTSDLTAAVSGCINPRQEKKELSQVFQALRMEVNGEMDSLSAFLMSTLRILRPGGRLAVLTYHSIEDRMVKNFLRSGNIAGEIEKDFFGRVSTPWKLITRNPIAPDAEEIERNPRSRSAKLRVAELLDTSDVTHK